MKIIDYAVASGRSATLMAGEVNEFIKFGYQPHGSPFYSENDDQYVQALVKYESNI